MGRKSHFTGLQRQLRIPAKAAVAGVPPVYRAVCRMAQGLLTTPMHPFDSFAACRDSRSPGLRCRAPRLIPIRRSEQSESPPERFAGRLKTLSGRPNRERSTRQITSQSPGSKAFYYLSVRFVTMIFEKLTRPLFDPLPLLLGCALIFSGFSTIAETPDFSELSRRIRQQADSVDRLQEALGRHHLELVEPLYGLARIQLSACLLYTSPSPRD